MVVGSALVEVLERGEDPQAWLARCAAASSVATLTIAARFCGPPTSANGGYFAGRVAMLAARTVRVRLLKPPPLETRIRR